MSELEWDGRLDGDDEYCYRLETTLIVLADTIAKKHGLDPCLICALCEVESSWNPWAVRHEAGYSSLIGFYSATDDRHRIWRDAKGQGWWSEINITPETRKYPWGCQPLIELLMQQTSWGLMRIKGADARKLGFTGWLTELCDPAVNLKWGCRHLRWMIDHNNAYGLPDFRIKPEDLAAAWNGGTRVVVDGKYKNQSYVDRVKAALVNYE